MEQLNLIEPNTLCQAAAEDPPNFVDRTDAAKKREGAAARETGLIGWWGVN